MEAEARRRYSRYLQMVAVWVLDSVEAKVSKAALGFGGGGESWEAPRVMPVLLLCHCNTSLREVSVSF